jgi:uncharacterized protein YjbJ (UPF0337 family)
MLHIVRLRSMSYSFFSSNLLTNKGKKMTNDILKGNWKQFTGEVQKQWGKLTNDDFDKLQGDAKKLEGLIQERYGLKKEEIKEKLDGISKKYNQ